MKSNFTRYGTLHVIGWKQNQSIYSIFDLLKQNLTKYNIHLFGLIVIYFGLVQIGFSIINHTQNLN